jgi:hypothetical protein
MIEAMAAPGLLFYGGYAHLFQIITAARALSFSGLASIAN